MSIDGGAVLYDRSERGPLWLWGIVLVALAVAPATELLDIPGTAFYVPCVLWGATLAAHFTRLRVRVTTDALEWRLLFTPGWNTTPISKIRSAESITLPPEAGLGTRVTRFGQCHSVGGVGGVRVDPSDADAFVLGTNTPSELVLAVEEARARASTTATPRLETMELPS